MSLVFPYTPENSVRPIWPLGGRKERPRPIIIVSVVGPIGTVVDDALLDTGADDTVFSDLVAAKIGVDLSSAPTRTAAGVGKTPASLRYPEVMLRISDGKEFREWPARVGFTSVPLSRPLLGFAGFLQFFNATFYGETEQVELTVNNLYPGT